MKKSSLSHDQARAKKTKPKKRKRSITDPLSFSQLEPRQLLAADVLISEFLASNNSGLVDGNGNESDWIELFNAGDQSQDLAGWHLTDDGSELGKWVFPNVAESVLAPGEYLVIFASGDGVSDPAGNLHTNFQLSASGEYLALTDSSELVVTEFGDGGVDYPEQFSDISYGVGTNGAAFFESPTPGEVNGVEFSGVVGDTSFDFDRGYYTSPFNVAITTATPGATIYYTTDGSNPEPGNGAVYTSPINISSTTNLRAAAYRTGYIPTNIDTQTYIFASDVLTQSATPAGFPAQPELATGSQTENTIDYAVDPDIALDPLYTQLLLDGLQDIPTLSLTSTVDDIFGANGIYTNSLDDSLEVPTSVEYILADGTTGFQIDAGLRVAGGASRIPSRSPKHSFTLRFRQEYGAGRLEYELFENSLVDSFNSLQLRAVYNNSLIHFSDTQRNSATLLRDQFVRDSLIALGHADAQQGEFTNLFINGLFWGVYNLHERGDSAHYAEYNGGDPDDYDAINGGTAIDGNLDSWNELRAAASNGTWQEVQERLDVDNFIDFTLLQNYIGNDDIRTTNNWRAAGGGPDDAPWRFYPWDSERSLENVNSQLPGTVTDPTQLLEDLRNFPEFVQRMEDRIQLHFFNGGALTESAVTERWQARVDEINLAIVGETARWGDYRADFWNGNNAGGPAELYERDVHWVAETQRILTEYLPARGSLVVDAFESLGYFGNVDAPVFQIDGAVQSGGEIESGALLTLSANDSIYYTTDGSDPRLEGGGINPNAILYDTEATNSTVIEFGSVWSYLDDGSNQDSTGWQNSNFDDSSWASGPARLGYGNDGEVTTVSYGDNASDKHITTYFRTSFDVTESFDFASLDILYDDGAVVYLNGHVVGQVNIVNGSDILTVDDINWQTVANGPVGNGLFVNFNDISDYLVIGSNTLAVEIHQSSGTSSDISFDAELTISSMSTPAIPLTSSTNVLARTFSNGEWSAVHSATFAIPAVQSDLRITEIHFNPAAPSAAEIAAGFVDNDDFEFIELFNPSTTGTINLGGVQLSDGVTFDFGDTDLLPGERVVVVEDIDAFMARYGDSATILGQWSGGLNNGGEEVTLLDSSLNEILSVNYDDSDPWYSLTDGDGFSLVLEDPTNTPVEELGKYYSWRASIEFGGTPGTASASASGVVINEIRANSDAQQSDTIELYNPTDQPIDVGLWFLSDSISSPFQFQIPEGTIISAGGYLVYDESDFNPTPGAPSANDFALSAQGDEVHLTRAVVVQGSVVPFVEESVSFGATFNGDSLGRLPNGTGRLTRLASSSFGSANSSDAAVGPLVISEVNYHPENPNAAALAIDTSLTDNDLEYIEVANPTSSTVDLTNWRLRGQSDYEFPAGTTLAAGEAILVVSFDPSLSTNANRLAAFEAHYGIDSAVTIVGGLSGSLSNSTGRISLQQPDLPDSLGTIPRVVVDELVYDDLSPWPDADGTGQVLERDDLSANGNLPSSWIAAAPTPGVFEDDFLLADINLDGFVSFLDISPFIMILSNNLFQLEADINQDGIVDFQDISPFINQLSG